MKLIKTFFLGATVMALGGCAMGGGVSAEGQKVNEAQFQEEAAKVEDHQYTKATVTYSIVEKHTGDGEPNVNDKGKLTFTYDGGWQLDAGQNVPESISAYEDYLGLKVSAAMAMIPDGSGYTISYYKSPLGILSKMSQSQSESGVSYSVSANAYMKFDKYGYLIKGVSTYKVSYKMNVAGQKASYSIDEKNEVTISYQ